MKKIYEDFFDDNEEILVDDEINSIESYSDKFILFLYFKANKGLLGKQSIDILPMEKVVKQFLSIANSFRFCKNYNITICLFSNDLLTQEVVKDNSMLKDIVFDVEYEHMCEKDYIKNGMRKLYDIYANSSLTGSLTINMGISFSFNPNLVSFHKFLKDFRKIQRYAVGACKLNCLSGLGMKNPMLLHYKNESGNENESNWSTHPDFDFNGISMGKVFELGQHIFGSENEYWSDNKAEEIFDTKDSKYNRWNISNINSCPDFLKKIAVYFKHRQEHYICEILGYKAEKDSRYIDLVVYLDVKDYDSLTVKNITDYMRGVFDKFTKHIYAELKNIGNILTIYFVCYELPEKRPGKKAEKLWINLDNEYPFNIVLKFVENESGEYRLFLDTAHTNPDKDRHTVEKRDILYAIEKYDQSIKDEISKVK